jgi:hypothetical protein
MTPSFEFFIERKILSMEWSDASDANGTGAGERPRTGRL